ncbi:hypothetical protein SPACI_055590 [Sporomusa acidovorans DSM 3132]|uniref:Uncharacterized protein n=1 Tax=Sporomusa acidovorans (strain ATCC 49682 / DSM 3132 / Mol) TaxID=1123286 RepID=A0ABZ3JBG0_SPOA4|nr:hypothetical protein SPACI_57310 [Sporomusa acidovorans DSM 3132]SDE00161.1 hypothetical protein SAMN04488499_1006119 [Sporomusa acidovorans]
MGYSLTFCRNKVEDYGNHYWYNLGIRFFIRRRIALFHLLHFEAVKVKKMLSGDTLRALAIRLASP